MSQEIREGGCRCGAVRYRAAGPPLWTAHCHCESCRRATGSPMATWVGYAIAAVSWSGREPRDYASSPDVRRTFCPDCGTPLGYEGARWPDEIHVLAATLDDPASVTPQAHVYWRERLPWLAIGDELPKIETTRAEARET